MNTEVQTILLICLTLIIVILSCTFINYKWDITYVNNGYEKCVVVGHNMSIWKKSCDN